MSVLQILNSSWDDTKKREKEEEERNKKEKNSLPLNSMIFFCDEEEK